MRQLARNVFSAKSVILLLACVLFTACGHRGPESKVVYVPAPPEPCPEAEVAQAKAPAEPSCETLEEHCKADSATWLEVGTLGFAYQPPDGWSYAREAEQSVSISPSGEALLAVAQIEGTDNKVVIAEAERLFKRLNVERVAAKWLEQRLHKADHTLEKDSLTVNLWEVGERQQFGKSPKLKGAVDGTALVFIVPLESGNALLGAAFASVNEAEAAPKIMASVQTLKQGA